MCKEDDVLDYIRNSKFDKNALGRFRGPDWVRKDSRGEGFRNLGDTPTDLGAPRILRIFSQDGIQRR